jgi:tetratricopeptide (TPR) repeat protein
MEGVMSAYHNELAPWERRNEYYLTIQLGQNVKEQTKVLNKQTKALIASQLASTNAIIASQERINEGIDNVVYGIERVEQGMYGLQATFEWGISEVVWQIEQNREVLKSILEILMAPLDTQAKERRKRAEEAYSNNWIDDAEEEFLEAEKLNKFDFSIHISLGLIYLFKKIDKEKALSYFDKAIKYAQPKSAYYTSYALLHKSLIKFDIGDINAAEQGTSDAIDLSPDFTGALYQNAQYNAQLKNIDKSISNLEKAIRKDKYYCLKANSDSLFEPIREKVNSLFDRLKDEEKQKALISYDDISNKHNKAYTIINDLSKESFTDISSLVTEAKHIDQQIREVKKRINRNSYYDFLDIKNSFTPQLENSQRKVLSDLKQKVKSFVAGCEVSIKSARSNHKNKIEACLGMTCSAILIGSFVVPAVMSLLAMESSDKFLFIVFCIPIISQIVSLVLIGYLIFGYTALPKGVLIIAWSLVVYLIGAIVYYFTAKSTSRETMESELKSKRNFKEKAMSYLNKINQL